MNIVLLTGRLTKDIECRYTREKQTAVAEFNLAVDRFKDEADFIRCKAFGSFAENLQRYCHKGSRIAILGYIQVRSYDDEGTTRFITEVIVDRQEFLDGRKSEDPDETQTPSDDFKQIDEDVPF